MKNVFAFTVLLIGLFIMNAIGGDFRQADWGMTVDEVKATEGPKVGVTGVLGYLVTLTYVDTISELSCRTRYFFVNDNSESMLKLVRGRYMFEDPVWTSDQFYWDYIAIKKAIFEQYGEPFNDRIGWTPEVAEPAVNSNDVSYLTEWQTSSTHIGLVLERYKDMWGFFLEFYSKELKYLEAKAQTKEDDAQEKIVFTGTPAIRIKEDGVSRTLEELARSEEKEYLCIINKIDDDYFWTTRENMQLVPITRGAFTTYIATNGSGYVRIVNPKVQALLSNLSESEQSFDYVEHLLLGLTTISYYGKSE